MEESRKDEGATDTGRLLWREWRPEMKNGEGMKAAMNGMGPLKAK